MARRFWRRPDGEVRVPVRLVLFAASFAALMWLTGRALPWARASFIHTQPEGTLSVDLLRGLASARWLFSGLGATAVVATLADGRAFARAGLRWHAGAGRDLGLGIGFASAAIASIAALLLVSRQAAFSVPGADAWSRLAALPVAVAVTLVIGTSEEFLFRGYPFHLLVEGLGRAGGIVTLAGLFGLAHLGAGGTLAGVLGTAAWGAFLCLARLRLGSLWFPIGFHWAGNLVEGVVFGMPTSGQSWSHPWLGYRSTGNTLLTGGAFGPEASLFSAAVALAAWLVLSVRSGRAPRHRT
ncbi:MAG TPA: CPBP family intramembrane glutamic endopeptidase [Anaeromyxobacteraceae bacterium]|nr:CPBP family intramembrane glutamic endopeptidase [Anaeromyxobacteraceae bacterium]